MKHSVPEISWHSRDGILSVDFQSSSDGYRIATGGLEKTIRIWKLKSKDPKVPVEFLSALKQHTATVNVVRFSKDNGNVLASGDVSGVIILWERSDSSAPDIFGEDDEEPSKEIWNIKKKLRGHIDDVSDLCWSPDSSHILSASMDRTVRVWKVDKGEVVKQIAFKGLPSGIGWDPREELLAVAVSDRSLCIHATGPSWRRLRNLSKASLPYLSDGNEENEEEGPERRLFHDDQLLSFIRRPAFSPCGELLLVPAGSVEGKDVTYLFCRKKLESPSVIYPCPDKPTITVAFSPKAYRLSPEKPNLFDLPYRLIFAILSTESAMIYDTQQLDPLVYIGKSHYAPLTDMSWSSDGQILVVTSVDGYCSITEFEGDELGIPLPSFPAIPAPAPIQKTKKRLSKPGDISATSETKAKKATPKESKTKEPLEPVPNEPQASKSQSVTPKTPKIRDLRQFFRVSTSGGPEKRKASEPPEINLVDSSSNESDGKLFPVQSSDVSNGNINNNMDVEEKPSAGTGGAIIINSTPPICSPLSTAGVKKPRRVALTTVEPTTAQNAQIPNKPAIIAPQDSESPNSIRQKTPKRVKLMPV